MKKRSTIFQQYLSKVSSFTQEIFSGIRVIKAYSLEDQHQNNMVELANESKSKSLNLAKIQALFGPLMMALIGISNSLVFYFVREYVDLASSFLGLGFVHGSRSRSITKKNQRVPENRTGNTK